MTRTRDPILDLLAPLRRYAFALTRDRAEADDLVQDALLRGHEQRRQLAPGKAPGPWLRAILRNRFLDRRRHDQAQSRREAQFAQLTPWPRTRPRTTPCACRSCARPSWTCPTTSARRWP